MVWVIQLLELSVPQYLELMLNNRDVNFLSISLDIALSPPHQVVVVACGLTLLHATPLGYVMTCHGSSWHSDQALLPSLTWQSQVRTMGVLSRMAPPGTHDSR